ncbi:MAG: NAD(P)-dependent oxidoreductase [Candidatus Nanopelagicales bacterium]
MSETVRVGFIGMGSIGKPMAETLEASGMPLTVWARRPEALESFGAAVVRASTPAELGERCDVVGVCVFDDASVEEVLFSRDGLLEGLAPGSVILIHSTVPPQYVVNVAARCSAVAVHVVDAPISGGPHVAALGELTVMLGGNPAVIERVQPVLDVVGSSMFHLGDVGAGQQTKLLNNTIFTAQLGLAESLCAVAADLGVDVKAMLAAIAVSSGRSFAAEMYGNAGGVEQIAAGAARPLLTKDVRILRSLARTDAEVIRVAEQFVDSMESAASAGNDGTLP